MGTILCNVGYLAIDVFDLYPVDTRSNNPHLVVKMKIQNPFLVENTENIGGGYKSNPTRN